MDASDYAAWYAAAVASAILVWDVIKYRNAGPQITGRAYAGRESYGIPDTEGKDLSYVELTNKGDRPTTLTSWGMYWYPAGSNLQDKSDRRAFIIQSGLAGVGQVPSKLGPGDVWTGVTLEDEEFRNMLAEGTLVFCFGFSHSDHELMVKIEPDS